LRDLIGSGYSDAAEATGRGLEMTWPNTGRRFPPPVTIDHILIDDRGAVRDYAVLDVPGTDHRAIFAELALPFAQPVASGAAG
jgi:hypothetical protein